MILGMVTTFRGCASSGHRSPNETTSLPPVLASRNKAIVSRPWGDRPGTLDDVQTTRAALGLHFNMTALMAAYQRRLDDHGVPIALVPEVR